MPDTNKGQKGGADNKPTANNTNDNLDTDWLELFPMAAIR